MCNCVDIDLDKSLIVQIYDLQQRNQLLKKEFEDVNEELELVRCDLHNRTSERDGYYRNIEMLENQQKEFIEYMNKTIEECNNYSKYIEKKTKELHVRSCGKTYIANEIMKNEVSKKILEEILSKYKEIIGV